MILSGLTITPCHNLFIMYSDQLLSIFWSPNRRGTAKPFRAFMVIMFTITWYIYFALGHEKRALSHIHSVNTQGPVQSLTRPLRVISLTVLVDSIYNILIFFAEKMWVAFAVHCKSYSHFFSKKFQKICVSLDVNFNKSLTNDIISFEELGPDKIVYLHSALGLNWHDDNSNSVGLHLFRSNKKKK